MPLFDPATVNRQIDNMMTVVPPGKRVTLVGNANLLNKQGSVALVIKAGPGSIYGRVTKTVGAPLEADAGFRISFLLPQEGDGQFTYNEVVALLRGRGYGWFGARLAARRLFKGGEVEL